MNRVWELFDPISREPAISLQDDAEEEEEINPGALTDDEIEAIVEKLPRLTEADLKRCGHHDSSCPICLNTFLASIAEEEMAYAMDSPAQPVEDLGVTRLADTCEHVFCRKDLLAWIRDRNATCPLCRARLIKSSPDSATVNTTHRRLSEAWRFERRILNEDMLRSRDFGYLR